MSAWKPESPGVSIRLSLRPCHSHEQSDADSDIWRFCSSSSQSETVVPASIVPSRFVLPAWKSRASTSEVLPVPRCPTTATLRIFPASMGIESSWARGTGRANPMPRPGPGRAVPSPCGRRRSTSRCARRASRRSRCSPSEASDVTVPRHEAPVGKFNASDVCSTWPWSTSRSTRRPAPPAWPTTESTGDESALTTWAATVPGERGRDVVVTGAATAVAVLVRRLRLRREPERQHRDDRGRRDAADRADADRAREAPEEGEPDRAHRDARRAR